MNPRSIRPIWSRDRFCKVLGTLLNVYNGFHWVQRSDYHYCTTIPEAIVNSQRMGSETSRQSQPEACPLSFRVALEQFYTLATPDLGLGCLFPVFEPPVPWCGHTSWNECTWDKNSVKEDVSSSDVVQYRDTEGLWCHKFRPKPTLQYIYDIIALPCLYCTTTLLLMYCKQSLYM